MRILLLSFLHPELSRGGGQQACYELFQELQRRGDLHVTLMAGIDPSFAKLYKAGALVRGFDGKRDEFLFLSRAYDLAWHRISERTVIAEFAEFLLRVRPDVVHFHHFLAFGVDLLSLTRRILPNSRIVFTFHEFMAICEANGQMVRKTDGSLCATASPSRCNQCFPGRSPESFFIRTLWIKRHFESIDAFTVPSKFMLDFYKRWGLDARRIFHVPNGQSNYRMHKEFQPADSLRRRFGFFGQFVDNKGVWLILEAIERLRSEGFSKFTVELNGANLDFASTQRRAEIEDFLASERARPYNERILSTNGSYEARQLPERMGRVGWCIVPSVWWESFGLVISEAWMFGRPVIASNVGGPAERIVHGKTGLLFNVGDSGSLAATIKRACTEKGLWERLVASTPSVPTASEMADQFLRIYRGIGLERADSTARRRRR